MEMEIEMETEGIWGRKELKLSYNVVFIMLNQVRSVVVITSRFAFLGFPVACRD